MNEQAISQIITIFSTHPFFVGLMSLAIIFAIVLVLLYLYNLFKNKLSIDSQNYNTSAEIITRLTTENDRLTQQIKELNDELKTIKLSLSLQHANNTKMLDTISNLEIKLKECEFDNKMLDRKIRFYGDVENDLN